MFCKNCGKEIADDAYVCPSCGKLTGQMQYAQKMAYSPKRTVYCRNCGSQMEEDAFVCPNCGVRAALPQQPTAAPVQQKSAGWILSLISFILAMTSIALGLLIPLDIGAIVCGAVGMQKQKKLGERYTFGLIGLIFGICLTAIWAAVLVLIILASL